MHRVNDMRRQGLLSVALWLALILPCAATADRGDEGRHYTGAYFATGIFSGPQVLSAEVTDPIGYIVGAYARISSVAVVMDGQFEYQYSSHRFGLNDEALTLQRHSLVLSSNLHPLFLRILSNNWLWYTLSAWYLQGGLSVEFTNVSDTDAVQHEDTALSLHLGTGIDTPLYDPNDWGSFWLGVSYRYKWIFTDEDFPIQADLDVHQVMMTLSYRFNNVSFARVPRPSELQYR